MTGSYKLAWSHALVADDPDGESAGRDKFPELATNADWRGMMKRARKEHLVDGQPMKQEDLAIAVGKIVRGVLDEPSQAAISKIEAGKVTTSRYVVPICTALSIPLPEHMANADDRDWIRIGRVLRARDAEQYKHFLALMENATKKLEPVPDDETPPKKRPRRGEARK